MTYNLFGKKADLSKIPGEPVYNKSEGYKYWVYYDKRERKYYYCGGDWGDYIPSTKIKKIVKIKKDVYDITFTNKLCCLDYENNRTENMGTTMIRVKANSKSSYKYVIIKLKYKGTGMGYF